MNDCGRKRQEMYGLCCSAGSERRRRQIRLAEKLIAVKGKEKKKKSICQSKGTSSQSGQKMSSCAVWVGEGRKKVRQRCGAAGRAEQSEAMQSIADRQTGIDTARGEDRAEQKERRREEKRRPASKQQAAAAGMLYAESASDKLRTTMSTLTDAVQSRAPPMHGHSAQQANGALTLRARRRTMRTARRSNENKTSTIRRAALCGRLEYIHKK